MRRIVLLCLVTSTLLISGIATAQNISDLPAKHWARTSVLEMVKFGVISLHGAKFDGTTKVTRSELAISLAKMAKLLEAGNWPKEVKSLGEATEGTSEPSGSVTRYELASVLDRAGRFYMHGRPNAGSKRYGNSDALMPPIKITTIKTTDPAFASVEYMNQNHMLAPNSILLHADSQLVSPMDVAKCTAIMIAGVIDRLTVEPEDKPVISKPPKR
ncbi:MAG: hypothetical protein ABJA67_04820 [Chthonomonadales bacterium]